MKEVPFTIIPPLFHHSAAPSDPQKSWKDMELLHQTKISIKSMIISELQPEVVFHFWFSIMFPLEAAPSATCTLPPVSRLRFKITFNRGFCKITMESRSHRNQLPSLNNQNVFSPLKTVECCAVLWVANSWLRSHSAKVTADHSVFKCLSQSRRVIKWNHNEKKDHIRRFLDMSLLLQVIHQLLASFIIALALDWQLTLMQLRSSC